MGKQKKLGITWTDYTVNLWWGCTQVSPACDNCYAMTFSHRLGFAVWGKDEPRRFFGERPYADLKRVNKIARKEFGRPARVFMNSMSDLFEDRRDLDEHRARFFQMVPNLENLEFLLLTKRIEAVRRLVPAEWLRGFPRNVRLGTTVESQEWANLRVPALLRLPAKTFLSVEPMLGQIDLTPWLPRADEDGRCSRCGLDWETELSHECPPGFGTRIDWVIVGSESGAQRRETKQDWVLDLATQCSLSATPFFVKQFELNGKVEKDFSKFPHGLQTQEFP